MRKLLGLVPAIAAILFATAGPVAATGAWVDRIADVRTVLAVRFGDDFPVASLMRANCAVAQFVQLPDGSGVETLRCELSEEPVMTPEFQGQPPSTGFTLRIGPCRWASDYWFARDGSTVIASSAHYAVTPSGTVNVTAYYPAEPLDCE